MTLKMEVICGLGEGSCGAVNLVSFDDGSKITYVAEKWSNDPESILDLRHEKEILDIFHGCPEIVQCLGDHPSYSDTENADEEDVGYSIFLEYVPSGSLADLIKKSLQGGKLSEPQVRRYTRSLVKGLAVVHAKGYVHCDVKPQNILVASSEHVKIADFDLAKRRGEASDGGLVRGTLLYVAPEGVAHDEYEPPADVWSLGCTVVEMLTGRPARKFPRRIQYTEKVELISAGNARPEIPEAVSAEGKDFLRRCLAENPKERWSAEMLLAHPFVSDDAGQMERAVFESERRPFQKTFGH